MRTTMNTARIREKLYDYIRTADDKKVKAIYAMVEEDLHAVVDIWEDKSFLAELDRRLKSYEDGSAKLYTLDEADQRVRRALQKTKSK